MILVDPLKVQAGMVHILVLRIWVLRTYMPPPFGSPVNKDHDIFGCILGRPIYGNPHIQADMRHWYLDPLGSACFLLEGSVDSFEEQAGSQAKGSLTWRYRNP